MILSVIYCTDEVIMDVQKSCFGGVMFAVG